MAASRAPTYRDHAARPAAHNHDQRARSLVRHGWRPRVVPLRLVQIKAPPRTRSGHLRVPRVRLAWLVVLHPSASRTSNVRACINECKRVATCRPFRQLDSFSTSDLTRVLRAYRAATMRARPVSSSRKADDAHGGLSLIRL